MPENRSVWIDDRLVANLPRKRFELLYLLMQKKGEIPWEYLMRNLWGKDGSKNDVEKAVQRLRADLGPEAHRIQTTRKGYLLRD